MMYRYAIRSGTGERKFSIQIQVFLMYVAKLSQLIIVSLSYIAHHRIEREIYIYIPDRFFCWRSLEFRAAVFRP